MLAAGSPEDRENNRSLESVTDKKTQAGCSSEPCRQTWNVPEFQAETQGREG